ncbi:unnamed protein product [Coffea canephora]|uniref:DH200=94 genomic scaffold, scaffold_1573 n=1 Tax=Coffea canephora TaxID=49390 RepID=A0A068VIU5_COFCA|nr:unnamed protein product [Coffea canephora]
MGVITFSEEYTYSIPPARLFKASVLDSHYLNFMQVIIVVTSIFSFPWTCIAGKNFSYLKYKIDELNEETYTYNYTVIEGDALSANLEKISYEVKFETSPSGGTVAKMTNTYCTVGDFAIKEEEVKAGKEKALGMYKAVEAYLVQNPDVYA